MSRELAQTGFQRQNAAGQMRRTLSSTVIAALVLLAVYVIAFHGIGAFVTVTTEQIHIQQQIDSSADRRWMPPLVPGL
jgi:succinate dehydrogenase/fumarate reductase cytochrome b subunit